MNIDYEKLRFDTTIKGVHLEFGFVENDWTNTIDKYIDSIQKTVVEILNRPHNVECNYRRIICHDAITFDRAIPNEFGLVIDIFKSVPSICDAAFFGPYEWYTPRKNNEDIIIVPITGYNNGGIQNPDNINPYAYTSSCLTMAGYMDVTNLFGDKDNGLYVFIYVNDAAAPIVQMSILRKFEAANRISITRAKRKANKK